MLTIVSSETGSVSIGSNSTSLKVWRGEVIKDKTLVRDMELVAEIDLSQGTDVRQLINALEIAEATINKKRTEIPEGESIKAHLSERGHDAFAK